MASALRQWILPCIEEELRAASETLEDTYIPGQDLEHGALRCQSGVLEVHTKKAKIVQVIEVRMTMFPAKVEV